MTTPMLLNLGLSGFGMSGADVGGFAGTPQPDLLTKWLEMATFQPIDRDHTAKGTGDQEPWVHGIVQEAVRRKYIEQRYRLMSYLYTTAEEMSRTGIPIVRPLFLDFPMATSDGHPLDLDAGGEFLFGPDLLVAPSPYPDELDPYELKLPPGDWYDYWTGELAARVTSTSTRDAEQPLAVTPADPQRTQAELVPESLASEAHPLMIAPTVETLPVYVRGGAIIPIQPLVQSTEEKPKGPLTLRVYVPGPSQTGTASCGGSVYLDDGVSFAFRQGQYLRMDSTCSVIGNELHVRVGPHQGNFQAWWNSLRVEVYGWHSSVSLATANNQTVPASSLANESITLMLPDPGTGVDLILK